jgi:hypothetical protein
MEFTVDGPRGWRRGSQAIGTSMCPCACPTHEIKARCRTRIRAAAEMHGWPVAGEICANKAEFTRWTSSLHHTDALRRGRGDMRLSPSNIGFSNEVSRSSILPHIRRLGLSLMNLFSIACRAQLQHSAPVCFDMWRRSRTHPSPFLLPHQIPPIAVGNDHNIVEAHHPAKQNTQELPVFSSTIDISANKTPSTSQQHHTHRTRRANSYLSISGLAEAPHFSNYFSPPTHIMAAQGASLQNYNNELVKCKRRLRGVRSICLAVEWSGGDPSLVL